MRSLGLVGHCTSKLFLVGPTACGLCCPCRRRCPPPHTQVQGHGGDAAEPPLGCLLLRGGAAHAQTHTDTHTCAHIYARRQAKGTHTHTCTHANTHTHKHTHTYTHMRAHTHKDAYIHKCTAHTCTRSSSRAAVQSSACKSPP